MERLKHDADWFNRKNHSHSFEGLLDSWSTPKNKRRYVETMNARGEVCKMFAVLALGDSDRGAEQKHAFLSLEPW